MQNLQIRGRLKLCDRFRQYHRTRTSLNEVRASLLLSRRLISFLTFAYLVAKGFFFAPRGALFSLLGLARREDDGLAGGDAPMLHRTQPDGALALHQPHRLSKSFNASRVSIASGQDASWLEQVVIPFVVGCMWPLYDMKLDAWLRLAQPRQSGPYSKLPPLLWNGRKLTVICYQSRTHADNQVIFLVAVVGADSLPAGECKRFPLESWT